MDHTIRTQSKITTIACAAEIAAIIGMLILGMLFAYVLYALLFNGAEVDLRIREEFLEKGVATVFSIKERILGIFLLLASDFWGLYGIHTARKLFAGYLRGEVFTVLAATRLKMIGWVVVLLAPISQMAETAGIFYFSRIDHPERIRLHLSLEDTDVYAIVFGLLILVVGHVMHEAVRLSDENRSFV